MIVDEYLDEQRPTYRSFMCSNYFFFTLWIKEYILQFLSPEELRMGS